MMSWTAEVLEEEALHFQPLKTPPSAKRFAYFDWMIRFTLEMSIRSQSCFALVEREESQERNGNVRIFFTTNNHNLYGFHTFTYILRMPTYLIHTEHYISHSFTCLFVCLFALYLLFPFPSLPTFPSFILFLLSLPSFPSSLPFLPPLPFFLPSVPSFFPSSLTHLPICTAGDSGEKCGLMFSSNTQGRDPGVSEPPCLQFVVQSGVSSLFYPV